jgi:ESCRT-II complex subunit VPS22
MRRGIGVGAVKNKKIERENYEAKGKEINETRLANVKVTLKKFETALSEFAEKHRDKINSDPEFRQQFHSMCVSVGVDPLASSKGFWSDILGVGDFYFELGIIVIQICLQTRSRNGGIISLTDLLERARAYKKKSKQKASLDDLKKAIEKLAVLGKGYQLIKFNKNEIPYLLSVPIELNRDHEDLMSAAQLHGYVSEQIMVDENDWTKERFSFAITTLLIEGIVWMDDHHGK